MVGEGLHGSAAGWGGLLASSYSKKGVMKEFKVGGWGSSGYCQVFSGWSPRQVGASKEGSWGLKGSWLELAALKK